MIRNRKLQCSQTSKSSNITCKQITGYRSPTRTSSRYDDLPAFNDEMMK